MDYIVWDAKFEAYATHYKWSPERQKIELHSLLQGEAENIVATRNYSSWTAQSLRAACRERLCKQYNVPLLKIALAELTTDSTEEPETIMRKIDSVCRRADKSIPRSRLKQLKYNSFMDLLLKHQKAMYFYIEMKLQDLPQVINEAGEFEDQLSPDPDEAVRLGKQYMKEKGYETRFMQEYVQDQFKVRGLADNTADTTGKIFPSMTVDQTKMTQASDDTNISARFLSKDQRATNEEIVVRLNEYERFMRKIRSSEVFQKQIGDDRERGRSQQRFERRSRSWDDRSRRDSYRDDRRRESGYREEKRREDSGYRRREDSRKDRSSDWKKKKQYKDKKPDKYKDKSKEKEKYPRWEIKRIEDNSSSDSDTSASRDDAFLEADQKQTE
jgi:hypothetical protein